MLQLSREKRSTTKNYAVRKCKSQDEFGLPTRNPRSSDTWSNAFTLLRESASHTGILFQQVLLMCRRRTFAECPYDVPQILPSLTFLKKTTEGCAPVKLWE